MRPWTPAFIGSLAAVWAASAQELRTLTAGQRLSLERGEPVQILERTASAWPRSIVYQRIAATPEQCAAVLSDYELQSSYVPRLKSSRIVRREGPDTDVEYVIDIPLYADERSVSRQRVTRNGSTWRVQWRTVAGERGGSTTVGSATFLTERDASGVEYTLMIHDQEVTPASIFAKVPFVRSRAIEASRDAASAIRAQIEREVNANDEQLRRQIARARTLAIVIDSTR